MGTIPKMKKPSLEQQIGQLFIIGFQGESVSSNHSITENIKLRHLGGVILFDRHLASKSSLNNIISSEQLRKLTNRLQQAAETPLLIAVDQEGGRVNRFRKELGFRETPPAKELGDMGDVQLIESESPANGLFANKDGRYAYRWVFETADDSGILLILRKGQELSPDEVDLVNQSLEVLAECLRRGLEYEDLFEKASNDVLTGLSNRRVFEERIHPMMDSAKRYNHPLSMISLDLDRFKEINDNLGHLQGDMALQSVAKVLKDAVRSTDLLVRMGGDEFLIVLDQTNMSSARVLAERLCSAVDGLDIWANETVKLGVSIGLSEMQKDESLADWLERTDDILYHAKAEGRSRVAVE